MNSQLFREELERVVGDSMRESGTEGISALLSDVMNIKNGTPSLKCQILKPTNNTLKANIRKRQCQKNSRISREYFAEVEMAIQFDTDTQALSQDTCCSADRNFHHSC